MHHLDLKSSFPLEWPHFDGKNPVFCVFSLTPSKGLTYTLFLVKLDDSNNPGNQVQSLPPSSVS